MSVTSEENFPNPEMDGIDHINIYSKGNTPLGKFLSNFEYAPIVTEDGHFYSIEGYWYWLGTNHKDKDSLRKLSGYSAKQKGRELKALDWQDTDEFKRKIKAAIDIKLETFFEFRYLLEETKLPLKHYYVYGGKVIEPKEASWIIQHIESYKKDGKSQEANK